LASCSTKSWNLLKLAMMSSSEFVFRYQAPYHWMTTLWSLATLEALKTPSR